MMPNSHPPPSPVDFIHENAQLFARCGAVVASYRTNNGRRFGPYYRLAYVQNGRQRSHYLGRSEILAQQVRNLLAQLQAPRNDRRDEARAKRRRQANLRHAKRHWQQILRAYGLYSRGWTVRGLRARGFPRIGRNTPEKVTATLPVPTPETSTTPPNRSPVAARLSPCPNQQSNPARPPARRTRLTYRQNRPLVDQLSRTSCLQRQAPRRPHPPLFLNRPLFFTSPRAPPIQKPAKTIRH